MGISNLTIYSWYYYIRSLHISYLCLVISKPYGDPWSLDHIKLLYTQEHLFLAPSSCRKRAVVIAKLNISIYIYVIVTFSGSIAYVNASSWLLGVHSFRPFTTHYDVSLDPIGVSLISNTKCRYGSGGIFWFYFFWECEVYQICVTN